MTGHLIDRAARYQPCPRCARHTLTAIDGGIIIRADPEPIGINTEIAALLAHRFTYDVHSYGLPRRMHLEWRDLTRIRAGRKRPVVASHACMPLPMRPAAEPETEITVPYPRNPQPEEPPF